jgi:restriction system protein
MGTVWTVKGGRSGEREDRLLEHGLIGGGWEALPSLNGIGSREELASVYQEAYPEAAPKTRANYVGQLWSLVSRMAEGDLVVLPLKTTGTIAVGRLSGAYRYREDLGEDLRHTRPVDWIATDVPRDAFDQDLLYSFGAFLTFGRVRRSLAEERIMAATTGGRTPVRDHEAEDEDAVADVEEAPDVESLAREQLRQHITQHFAGHELARLVAAVLEAQGFTNVLVSPPGPDRGVDILAGSGPLGMDAPRLAVQVKTGQAGVDEFRALRGVMEDFRADQGLLVAWGGFRGNARQEARHSHFTVRLWDATGLLRELEDTYADLDDDLRSELPLKRIWTLVPDVE